MYEEINDSNVCIQVSIVFVSVFFVSSLQFMISLKSDFFVYLFGFFFGKKHTVNEISFCILTENREIKTGVDFSAQVRY